MEYDHPTCCFNGKILWNLLRKPTLTFIVIAYSTAIVHSTTNCENHFKLISNIILAKLLKNIYFWNITNRWNKVISNKNVKRIKNITNKWRKKTANISNLIFQLQFRNFIRVGRSFLNVIFFIYLSNWPKRLACAMCSCVRHA